MIKKKNSLLFRCWQQALRFYGSFNVTVTGITIQNSPQCHLKFDNCIGVLVHDMVVSSPGDSPNTDGIHLQNSKDVLIHGTDLACGKFHLLDLFLINCLIHRSNANHRAGVWVVEGGEGVVDVDRRNSDT